MRSIMLFAIFFLVFTSSGCVWEGVHVTAAQFCEQQGGTVVTGPSSEGSVDFCLLADQSYCRASDFQSGSCKQGEKFYKCSLVGSRSEGYYDRDTFALISFVQCGSSVGGAGAANPAAIYCLEQGGTVLTRNDPRSPAGGQYGVCILENETECDEWAFYRGGCDSCLTHCIKNFNAKCAGQWNITGEYPDCNCGWICD